MAASTNTPGVSTAAVTRSPKTFTVTLSLELGAKLEALAERERRDPSELLREAVQDYCGDSLSRNDFHSLKEVREYAASRNPYGYTEDDIPRLIKEVRAERAAQGAAKAT